MRDLRGLLIDADPVAERPELPAEETLAIRRAVVAAATAPPAARSAWPGAFAVAALGLVMAAAGLVGALTLSRGGTTPDSAAVVVAQDEERRQFQFATPGGTRVIWTLDPDFELQGGTP